MILPTKHLPAERALLTLGSELLTYLSYPRTVSALWDLVRETNSGRRKVSYDWFLLGLDFLFMVGAVELRAGVIAKVTAS
jgi:hypothetical protein